MIIIAQVSCSNYRSICNKKIGVESDSVNNEMKEWFLAWKFPKIFLSSFHLPILDIWASPSSPKLPRISLPSSSYQWNHHQFSGLLFSERTNCELLSFREKNGWSKHGLYDDDILGWWHIANADDEAWFSVSFRVMVIICTQDQERGGSLKVKFRLTLAFVLCLCRFYFLLPLSLWMYMLIWNWENGRIGFHFNLLARENEWLAHWVSGYSEWYLVYTQQEKVYVCILEYCQRNRMIR